jgi:hypothetical protein
MAQNMQTLKMARAIVFTSIINTNIRKKSLCSYLSRRHLSYMCSNSWIYRSRIGPSSQGNGQKTTRRNDEGRKNVH